MTDTEHIGADAMPARAVQPKFAAFARELRAEFLPASALPVFVGTALAFYRTGVWRWPRFLWCLAGMAAIHAGANVLNDYFDHRSGNDAVNREFVRPFTGGSRLIQNGSLTPRDVLYLGVGLLLAGLGIGVGLAAVAGWPVLWLAAVGAAAGVAYSIPRAGLAARGLGEPTVAVVFGVLPVLGAYYVQTGTFHAQAAFLSLPIAVLIAAVLFINQFQDSHADEAVGKRHWVVRLGRRRSARVYAALMLLWPGILLLTAAAGLVPGVAAAAAGVGLLGLPAMIRALRHFDHPADLAPANALTVATHAAATFAMGAALVAARMLHD